MRSTPEMRARIRELMTGPQDDYDRAVECVLNDFEALEAARAVDLQTCADQLEQNTATMNTAAKRIEALEAALRFALEVMENYSKLDGRDPSYATPSSAIGVARAALAEGQAKCIHSWSAPFDGVVKCTKCGAALAPEQDK